MAYRVVVQPSRISFSVKEDETVLEAALRCGFFFPHNCRIGACGKCKGKVLQGEVDYAGRDLLGLSETESEEGDALFCSAKPKSDLVIFVAEMEQGRLMRPDELIYTLTHCENLSNEVTRIVLQAPDDYLRYEAGQYIKIVHQNGELSPLSIANAPYDYSTIELHLAHPENNQSSQDILRIVTKEKKLTLRGPYGSATKTNVMSEHPIIFLARGTGFAPIKAIIEEIMQLKKYPPMHLFWSATTQDELYLDALAKEWESKLENFSYTPVLSRANPTWLGKTGLLQHVILLDYPYLADYRVYVSAPEPIVHSVLDEFLKVGLQKEHYFSDVFDYDPNR